MEQKPMRGAEPLDPPSPEIAKLYLEEIGVVAQRREERIDRRGMAKLNLIEAFILGAYLTFMMFTLGVESSNSINFILIIGLYLLWIQLMGDLREGYGFQSRNRRDSWRYGIFAAIMMIGFIVVVVLQIDGATLPLVIRILPGALVFVVFGYRGVKELSRAGESVHARSRAAMPIAAKIVTIVWGLIFAMSVFAAAYGDDLFAAVFGMLLMLCYLGWFFATHVSDSLPTLGSVWAWPQWTAFAVAAVGIATCVLLSLYTTVLTPQIGLGGAGIIAGLFLIAAFMKGQDV